MCFFSSELWKSRERIKKLDAVSKRRDLPERERLVFQLQEYQEKLDNKEKQITVRNIHKCTGQFCLIIEIRKVIGTISENT